MDQAHAGAQRRLRLACLHDPEVRGHDPKLRVHDPEVRVHDPEARVHEPDARVHAHYVHLEDIEFNWLHVHVHVLLLTSSDELVLCATCTSHY